VIKSEFKIRNALAGDDADGATKVASQIAGLKNSLADLGTLIVNGNQASAADSKQNLQALTQQMSDAINALKLEVSVSNEPLPGLDAALVSLSETMETSFIPIVVTMNKKLSINNEVLEQVTELSKKIKSLSERKTTKTITKASSKTDVPKPASKTVIKSNDKPPKKQEND
jgi:hypothetical protein